MTNNIEIDKTSNSLWKFMYQNKKNRNSIYRMCLLINFLRPWSAFAHWRLGSKLNSYICYTKNSTVFNKYELKLNLVTSVSYFWKVLEQIFNSKEGHKKDTNKIEYLVVCQHTLPFSQAGCIWKVTMCSIHSKYVLIENNSYHNKNFHHTKTWFF